MIGIELTPFVHDEFTLRADNVARVVNCAGDTVSPCGWKRYRRGFQSTARGLGISAMPVLAPSLLRPNALSPRTVCAVGEPNICTV